MPNYLTPYNMGYGTQLAAGSTPYSTSNSNPYATQGGSQASSGLPGYNVTPTPTTGQGAYGLVPGTIDVPPSLWQQTTSAVPGLGNTDQFIKNITAEGAGELDPQALRNIQDTAARFGVSSGMPGSNATPNSLAFNKTLRDVGLDTYAVKQQGIKDYNSLLGSISGLQTPQSLAAEIAAHNAQLKAAPDPQTASQQQLANYLAALNATRGPAGGTGGYRPSTGTGNYAPAFNPADYGYGRAGSAGTGSGYTAGGSGYSPDALYPGTEVPGLSNLSSILGPQASGYGTDYGQPSYGSPADYSDPYSWDFTNYNQSASPDFSGYDQAFTNPEDYYAGILAGGY